MRFFPIAAAVVCLAVPVPAALAGPLFPKPLHLVRRIDDPVARTTHVVDEYCLGNRVISINGPRVAIVDYDRRDITEIDHADGTYSITKFEEVATARAQLPLPRAKASSNAAAKRATALRPTALGVRATATSNRSLERWRADLSEGPEKRTLEIGIDRTIPVSKEAAEVLVGAAFPYERTDEQDQILLAAAPAETAFAAAKSANATAAPAPYGLPSESVTTYEAAGVKVEIRTAVLRVDDELPPAQLLRIDPGAQRIDSLYTRMRRELDELDKLPTPPPARKP